MYYTTECNINCLSEIEKYLLSTLIKNFDTNKVEECLKIINENDFYDIRNRFIYKTILDMYRKNEEIKEYSFFLVIQRKIDKQYYLDIMKLNSQSSITYDLKKIRQLSIERQIINLASKIKEGDFNQIKELNQLREQLDNLGNIKNLKKIDDNFDKLINIFDLDVDKIRNKKIEFLYDDFIIKNDITMIVARPGIGKSLLSISLCNMLLSSAKIDRIIYFDGDNSASTIKQRDIHLLKEKFNNRLNYIIEFSHQDFFKIVDELKKRDLNNCLIVLDSIKNFIIGDRNAHKDVTEVMNILKELRKNGSSVIFLHHQNKLNKDFNSAFAGSSAFLEDVASAYELNKNEDKQTYIFTPLKDRNNIAKCIAFSYNNNTITKVDIDYARETREDSEIRELIINFLISCDKKPIYSDILNSISASGYNKDKVNTIIQNGKNKYWNTIRHKKNNKLFFELIDIQDNQDKQDNLVSVGAK